MKEMPRTVLSYLVAFSLGIICATSIYIGLQKGASQVVPAVQESSPANEPRFSRAPSRNAAVQGIDPLPPTPAFVPEAPDVLEPSKPEARTERTKEFAQVSQPPSPTLIAPVVQRVVPVTHASSTGIGRGGGRISGTVRLDGIPPAERPLPLDPTCGAVFRGPKTTRFYKVGKDNGLADTVVVITSGLEPGEWAPSENPLVIAQSGCLFEPYIVAAQVNQPLRVVNREKIMHNVRVTSSSNGEFIRALLPGASVDFQFSAPEWMIRLKCEVHPWDYAYVSTFPHPFFAVTDRNGDFVISNVPPGHYTVQALHRKAGSATQETSLDSNRGATLHFVLKVNGNDSESNRADRSSPQARITAARYDANNRTTRRRIINPVGSGKLRSALFSAEE